MLPESKLNCTSDRDLIRDTPKVQNIEAAFLFQNIVQKRKRPTCHSDGQIRVHWPTPFCACISKGTGTGTGTTGKGKGRQKCEQKFFHWLFTSISIWAHCVIKNTDIRKNQEKSAGGRKGKLSLWAGAQVPPGRSRKQGSRTASTTFSESRGAGLLLKLFYFLSSVTRKPPSSVI